MRAATADSCRSISTRACFRSQFSRLRAVGVWDLAPRCTTISPSTSSTRFPRALVGVVFTRTLVCSPRNRIPPTRGRSARRALRSLSTRRSWSRSHIWLWLRKAGTSSPLRSVGSTTSTPLGPTRTRSFRADFERTTRYSTRQLPSRIRCCVAALMTSAYSIRLGELSHRWLQKGGIVGIRVEPEPRVCQVPRLRQQRSLDPAPAADRVAPAGRQKAI